MTPKRSIWQSPLGPLGASAFSGLERDQTADVCVIGAGMAGLLTALELAERGRSVIVLEREGLAAGQTGASWDCPCHGSRFDCYGKVLAGPAVSDLEPLPRADRAPAKAG